MLIVSALARTNRTRLARFPRRMWRAGLVALALGSLLPRAQLAVADTVCVEDTALADDINANQKDLNEFCQSAGNDGGLSGCALADANLTWTWDDTAWTGSNTGDGCALYDTNDNGKADFALCATVQSNPAVQSSGSPRFYSCDDSKTLNCGSSSVKTATSSCVVSNITDPFTGEHKSGNVCTGTNCTTRDTQAQCCVKHSDFPADTSPELIDVCSYPSSSPSSSPSECVKAVICTNNSDCSDLNDACNVGTCASDGLTKRCVATPKTNGTSCNDGNACTQTDTCQSGTCTGGSAVTCTASDQCHVAGTCDTTTGQCSNPAASDGTGCSDGNACTQTDTCQSGTCTGSNPVTCTALDQCHDAGTCNTTTGLCTNPNKSNGSTCSDGNACTQTDTCQGGSCTGSNAVVCTASDQCHDAGTCDTSTGTCSNPSKTNGSTCSDGNACTQTDTCQGGTCTGSNPVTCSALDQCHDAGTCNTTTGICSNPNKANGSTCSDGNACTQTDTCQGGSCTGSNPVVCSASDQCHDAGTCDTATGTCSTADKANGSTCNDGNACTQTDTCQSGACTGGNPVVCTALDQCHDIGTCDTATGTCSNPNKADTSSCNDGNACTQTDTCQGGTCTGSNPVTCAALDQCHVPGTCNTTTGVCTNPNKTNGSGCNDGNACTQTDTCQNGSCSGGNTVVCTALDQCHVPGTCNTTTGSCSNPNAEDGTTCSDASACTLSDTCQGGTCVGGNSPSTQPGCKTDTGGADDAVGQKDLNEFCVNRNATCAGTIFTWKWDDTAWTGTNTGDACALYDTNGNSRANYALCVTVTGKPAVQATQSPRFYSCNDSKQFNCAGATLVTIVNSICSVNDLVVDPFAALSRKSNKCAGTNCLTKDTQAQCCVNTADLPATAALIDVCSYPSQSPSSDPSECVKTVFCSSNADCTTTNTEGTCNGTCTSIGGVNQCVF